MYISVHTIDWAVAQIDTCRSDPSWGWRESSESGQNSIRATCTQRYTGYIQHHHHDDDTVVSLREEEYQAFRDCCGGAWNRTVQNLSKNTMSCDAPSRILQSPRTHFANGTAVALALTHALTESELNWLESIRYCVRSQVCPQQPTTCRHLTWNQGNGHKQFTYLKEVLLMAAPSIAVQMMQMIHAVWLEADWSFKLGLPDPRTLSWRRLQHVVYQGWGPLNIPHADEGSVYTISLSLSTPRHDFDGGVFFVHPYGSTQTNMSLPRGDAVVFLSEQPHCATDMPKRSSGNMRSYLIGELWDSGGLGTAKEEL